MHAQNHRAVSAQQVPVHPGNHGQKCGKIILETSPFQHTEHT